MLSSAILLDSFACACIKSMQAVVTATEFLLCGAHPHVAECINALDVEHKMQIVSCFLEEMNGTLSRREYMKLIIRDISDIVRHMERDILSIQIECDTYKTRYFSYWRTPNVKLQLQSLQEHSACFDRRVDYLLRFSAIIGDKESQMNSCRQSTLDKPSTPLFENAPALESAAPLDTPSATRTSLIEMAESVSGTHFTRFGTQMQSSVLEAQPSPFDTHWQPAILGSQPAVFGTQPTQLRLHTPSSQLRSQLNAQISNLRPPSPLHPPSPTSLPLCQFVV